MGSRHCAVSVCCSMGGSICSSFDRNGDSSVIIKGSRKTAFFALKIPVRCDILSFDKNRGRKLFMDFNRFKIFTFIYAKKRCD